MNLADDISKKFRELFNEEPLLVRSPGRVNLIGEHTDYNMGFVLPAAIDKAIYFAISPRNDDRSSLHAYDLNDSFDCSISNISHQTKGWANYLLGVVDQLKRGGYNIKGFNCAFGGDVPIGAGLSSSAAIESGLAFTLNQIFGLNIDKLDLVKLAQKSENEFVGVQCGIMDQYINIFGKDKNVLRIDCRSLEYEYFPFDCNDISVVLFDSRVSHSLASSEYNKRRKECSIGLELIRRDIPEIESLRDVSIDILRHYQGNLDDTIYRRCKYVVEENIRLQNACSCLLVKDLKSFGSYMYQTHQGLSKEYEVSCAELDFLVEETKLFPEVYGARVMGGGFGGCTINLIENDSVNNITKIVMDKYKSVFGKDGKVYVTKISDGTSIIS